MRSLLRGRVREAEGEAEESTMETLRAPLLHLHSTAANSSLPRCTDSNFPESRLSTHGFPSPSHYGWKFSVSKSFNTIMNTRSRSSELDAAALLDDTEENAQLLDDEYSEEEFAALSAKEKRKIRNRRRQNSVASPKPRYESSDEEIIKSAAAAKAKVDPWKELEQMHLMGPQWWMISLATSQDVQAGESLTRDLKVRFPDLEFEVFVPTIVSHKLLKDGTVVEKPVKLAPGSIYLRCTLTVKLFELVKSMSSVRGIAGTKTGRGIKMMVLPDAVSERDIVQLKERVEVERKKLEEAFLLSQKEREDRLARTKSSPPRTRKTSKAAEIAKPKSEAELSDSDSDGTTIAVKSAVKILSGPFRDLDGEVIQVLTNNKAQISVNIFGRNTTVELERNQFQVFEAKTV